MLLLDVGTVSVDKTRLQSNNRSFPHNIVGCWHGIRRQDAAAIKQLEFSSCYCGMLAQYPLTRRGCNQTTGVFLMLLLDVGTVSVDKTRLQSNNRSFPQDIVGCWHGIRRPDAAAIKQLEFSSCYCGMLAQYPLTRRGCNQTTGFFLVLLLDVGTVSVDKTRLQSNNWSFPRVFVG